MKKLSMLACALLGAFVVIGCGSSDATATKKEEDSFRNPQKTMPKEAQEAMAGHSGPPPAAASGGPAASGSAKGAATGK